MRGLFLSHNSRSISISGKTDEDTNIKGLVSLRNNIPNKKSRFLQEEIKTE